MGLFAEGGHVLGVRTVPGAIAFTRTPRGHSSTARLWVSPATPAFAAL